MATREEKALFKQIRQIVDPEQKWIRVYNEQRKGYRRMKFWYGNTSEEQVTRVERLFQETGISNLIIWHGIIRSEINWYGLNITAYVVKLRNTECQLNKELI